MGGRGNYRYTAALAWIPNFETLAGLEDET
jgi:hypothetical protein